MCDAAQMYRKPGFILHLQKKLPGNAALIDKLESVCLSARISSTTGEKAMNKDQAKGTGKVIAGKVQQATGKFVGNSRQQIKGLQKQIDGEAERTVGDIKEAIKDVTSKHHI